MLSLIESVKLERLHPSLMAPMMQLQGDILVMLGRFEQASTVLDTASEAARDANLAVVYSEILGSQADIAMKQGQTDKALSAHKEALEVQVELGDAQGAARTYNNMGYLYRRKNNRNKALEAYSEVEAIITNDETFVDAQIILGRALLDLGEVNRARKHAFEAFERTGKSGKSTCPCTCASIAWSISCAKMNDAETSMHHYTESLNIMSDVGDPVSMVELMILLGEVLEDSGGVKKLRAIQRSTRYR